MNRFVPFLYRIANGRILIFLAIINLIFPLYLFKNAKEYRDALSGTPLSIIDTRLAYSPEQTRTLLHAYTPEVRQYYAQTEMSLDMAYPIAYAFFFTLILALLFKKNRFGLPAWVVVIPFVAMLFDFAENVFIYKLLTDYPKISNLNVHLCEIAKTGKWLCFFPILALVIYGLIKHVSRLFYRKT
jgi:hypothetical protein